MLLPRAPVCSAQHCIQEEMLSLDIESGGRERSWSRRDKCRDEHMDVVFKTTELVEVRSKKSMKTEEIRVLKSTPWGDLGRLGETKGAARRGLGCHRAQATRAFQGESMKLDRDTMFSPVKWVKILYV